jgi:hypothetical protein
LCPVFHGVHPRRGMALPRIITAGEAIANVFWEISWRCKPREINR